MDILKKNHKYQFKIDDDDKKIIEILEKKPNLSHTEVAKRIGKPQSTVRARIIKLENTHILSKSVGFNIKKVNIPVAIVLVSTKDIDQTINLITDSRFINFAFIISGEYNLLCFVAGPDISKIDTFVNLYFRQVTKLFKSGKIIFICSSILKRYSSPLSLCFNYDWLTLTNIMGNFLN